MRLPFAKMHGLGNDFVVFDATGPDFPTLDAATIRRLADRHRGIGCDQVLLVESPTDPAADFGYRIFNGGDGGEVEQCGNGARCFARFLRRQGLSDKAHLLVDTAGGRIQLIQEDDGRVTVDMGVPRLAPAQVPFDAPAQAPRYPLTVAGRSLEVGVVSMGNPHAVLAVPAVAQAPVAELGPAVQADPRFPRGVNVGFMACHGRQRLDLRVYERGAGETQACGTGACAAVVVGRINDWLDERVRVTLPGGQLDITWPGPERPVLMTGPAEHVFDGQIEL